MSHSILTGWEQNSALPPPITREHKYPIKNRPKSEIIPIVTIFHHTRFFLVLFSSHMEMGILYIHMYNRNILKKYLYNWSEAVRQQMPEIFSYHRTFYYFPPTFYLCSTPAPASLEGPYRLDLPHTEGRQSRSFFSFFSPEQTIFSSSVCQQNYPYKCTQQTWIHRIF